MKKICLFLLVFLTACATEQYSGKKYRIESGTTVVLMPIVNHSTKPYAGQQAEDILFSLWAGEKLPGMIQYPKNLSTLKGLPDVDDQNRFERAKTWLSGSSSEYYLTGTVEEWRYRPGLDAEPAVGITLNMYRRESGQLVWSSTGSRTGGPRESLSSAGQTVLRELISRLAVQRL